MTFYHVPHLALGAEIATDYHQRSTLYSFNTFFAAIGSAVFVPLSYFLFFPTTEEFNPALLNRAAYTPWGVFAGGLMIFAILVCVGGTYREIPRLRALALTANTKFSMQCLVVEVMQALQNRSFRAIFFGMILSTFIVSVENVFNPFMGFHFWGMTTEQLKYPLLGSVLLIIININFPIVIQTSWYVMVPLRFAIHPGACWQ